MNKGDSIYYVFVNYEILGEFITNGSVYVVVIIKDFKCHKKVLDRWLVNSRRKLKVKWQRFFDTQENIEILMLQKRI